MTFHPPYRMYYIVALTMISDQQNPEGNYMHKSIPESNLVVCGVC